MENLYSNPYAIAADLAILAILALTLYCGWKRGLFRSLLSLVTTLASLIGAMHLTRKYLDPIADKYFPMFEEKLLAKLEGPWSEKVKAYAELTGINLSEIAQEIFSDILRVILILIVFAVLKLVLHFVIRKINDILFKIPLVGFVNHLGGLVFGAAVGAAFILLAVFVLDKLTFSWWTESKAFTLFAAWISANNPIIGFFAG